MFCLLVTLIQLANSEWRLIYSDFYQEILDTNLNWQSLDTCQITHSQQPQTRQCITNNLEFIRFNENRGGVEKQFYYPHYQLRIITDVIYIRSESGVDSVFQIQIIDSSGPVEIYKRLYKDSDLQKYKQVCDFDCIIGCDGLDESRIEIKTHIFDGINHQIPIFKISYCFQPQNGLMRIGLRNILIYGNSCHISCATCNGSTQLDCLTCYQGSLQGGICVCDESNKYIHRLIGCVQECPKDYYLADNSNYCQFDPRIKQMYNYFTSTRISNGNQIPYEPWIYQPDPFHISNLNNIFDCSGQDQVGKFSYSQSMQLKLPQNEGLIYLRIRVSFHFFGWQSNSVLKITVDQYSQMRIEKTQSNYTIFNGKLNKFQSLSCSSNNYDFLRIETILKTYTTTPIIQFQAIQQFDNEFWSFNNVTIDYGLCQSNCTKCETFSKCLICQSGFKLYRGTCVQSCPIHSQLNNIECLDYEDIINNSRYLIKAFYDMNTTFEEVTKVVDNFTDLNDDIQTSFTGSIYSFVPEKSVLGGVLVWWKGKFKKTFINLQPHYKVTIRMNITYGDENNGWFQYQLDSYQSTQINNPKTGNINLVGDNKKETTKFIEYQQNHNSIQLDIILSGNTEGMSLEDSFIYVSEYFVIVHYCVPFCSSCTGPTISDCNSYIGYNLTHYCSSNQYLQFNSDTQIYSCQQCNQLGCLECQNELQCTRCEYSDNRQFFLDQDQCICYPSYYLSNNNQCLKCHKYCESCFGSNYDQCYSCNIDFHRSINQYKCQCLNGFYDDGYNLECIPICGDQQIVLGEDCDDGNNNPFDGCDQCKYQCQDVCLNCHNGKCYQCKDGYTYDQTTYKCLTTCGDQIIQGNEQCDDGNNSIQDGCYLCKFQCDIHCINCQNGYCIQCDEFNGWYFNGYNCQYICGDGIITKEYEQCDDNNYNPFDLCDNCHLGCSDHCIICQNGMCLQCEIGFQFQHQTKQCLPICGDSIIVGYEQCENGSNSCNQLCKFKCNTKCLICQYNTCLQCEYGYQLRNNICEEQCGDGITIGDEECENIYIYQQQITQGCLNCKYDCGSGCIICTKGICELCKSGYIREQYKCKPICGDMYIVDPEVCEDANMEPYDGCHLCQYSCVPQCLTCSLGICTEMQQTNNNPIETIITCSDYCLSCQNEDICLICEQYFQLNNFYCIPICGDGFIIPGLEQCEDGNDIPFDGCYQCQYQCSYGCIQCEQFNKCIKCEDDLYKLDIQTNKCILINQIQNNNNNNIDEYQNNIISINQLTICDVNYILMNNICINLCGNGQLNTEFEECDDNNNLGGDGCSQHCTIEPSYQCLNIEDQLSQCTFINSPEFKLNVLSDKLNSTQIVELTFSQQVKLKKDLLFENITSFQITPITNYTLIIQPIENISTILNYPIYHIYIIFKETIQDPLLEIQIFNQTIYNEFDVNLQKYKMKINIGNPFVLSEETQDKLQSVIKMNEATMYSMAGISSLAIATGNTIMLVNLIDLLQSLSYLRYMQYQFPPHLIEFLNSYTKVSLQPILDQLKINELLIKLNGGTLPFQQKNNKKQGQSNPLNQFFLLNAKSCYFSIITSIIIYFICCFASSNQLNTILIKIFRKYKINGRILKIIILFQKEVQQKTLKLKNEYFSIGIFNVYQTILHQFVFSSLLQFPDYNFYSIFQIFNSINAICSLLFITITSLQLLTITSSLIKDKQRWKYFYKDSKMQFWAANCKSFQIYRILIYIFIIVKLIDYPQVQSLLLSMQSFFYFIYLIKFKPLQSIYELNKLKYREFLFMLITGSFIIYSFEFTYDQYMMFGWIHISMISLMLIINLIIDIIESINKAKANYQKEQQKKELQEIKRYYNNPLQRLVFHRCNTPIQIK